MTRAEISLMREAGALLSEVACVVHEHVVPGVSGLQINQVAEEETLRRGCIPAFKGYRGYRHTVCVSVNEQVVHGIPTIRKFEIDDVVSVDLGLSWKGYFADMAFTMVLGADPKSWALQVAAEKAWRAGFNASQPGARVGDIGFAIQQVIESKGYGVVTSLVGHGIGRVLHDTPQVPNFGKRGTGPLLKPGMCLAIEPMITMGNPEVKTLEDGWTVVTKDKSLAAHYEHTILITNHGPELLTGG